MESKPKKVLSQEQLLKMQEGRKKATEKRKKEREEAKKNAVEFTNAKKSNNKEKLLQLELEALQQQQDRIDNLKMQVERKKQVKSKLKKIKNEEEEPQPSPQTLVAQEPSPEPLPSPEPSPEPQTLVAPAPQTLVAPAPKPAPKVNKAESQSNLQFTQPSDEEYEKVFKEQSKIIRNTIPKEVRKEYDSAINKFDFTLSLDENINSMIKHVKDIIKTNTETASNFRKQQKEEESKKEIVQKSFVEKVTEQAVDSKIYKLMKLK